MRIARDGTWFYHGTPITRKPLVKLFARVLRRDENGDFWLVTPVERARIVVDDAPFTAVAVDIAGSGRRQVLRFRTNLDEEVTADAAHPIIVRHDAVTGEPSPYVQVREGLQALIARPVYYELVDHGCERTVDESTMYGIWSSGTFFSLGNLDPD